MQTRPSEDLVPLVKFPARHRREPQLYIVDPTSSRRKRRVDTCFSEPRTGREITALASVQRHLVGDVNQRRLSRSPKFYEKRRTEQDHRLASKDFRLPKGWTVEGIQRRDASQIDKVLMREESFVSITLSKKQESGSVERYLNSNGNGTVASVSKVHSEQLLAICNGIGCETVVSDPNPPEKVK
ncbi:hypothetical protein Bca52824_022584 [Brassica carinata]|uniref:Uncharacterized protein n=1 Tax=Brassica carinata TaxID=52824 RepID=A0A8X7VGY7_BRACI|nr:hypothetical protein Bca52824_022584 [Brassica carinata]